MRIFLSAPPGATLIKTAESPQAALNILHKAAREMGAEISRTGDSPVDNITLTVHGKENGVVWAVQADIKRVWNGSSVELTALGKGMECTYDVSVKHRDALADVLRTE